MSRLISVDAASNRIARRRAALHALVLIAIVVALLTTVAGAAQAADSVRVEVQVQQHAGPAGDIRVGARSADGSWPAPEMIPLTLDNGASSSGRYRYGDIAVAVHWRFGTAPVTVEVRVWQHVEDGRDLWISARGSLGYWRTLGTVPLALAEATGSPAYRSGGVTIEAPLPEEESGAPPRYRLDPAGENDAPRGQTLSVVLDRGELRCGVKLVHPLVSGFDIEFCKSIAAAVLGDPAKVDFVDVSDALSRFELLGSGEIDVLIRTLPIIARYDRELGVDFAHPTFWTGLGFAVWSGSQYETTSDMDGATICVLSGTIAEQYLADHFVDLGIEYYPLGGEWGPLADAFFSGRCDVLAANTVELAAEIAVRDETARYRILPQVISRDAFGPAVRDHDSEWKDVVNWVIHGLIAAEELGITQANVAGLAANPPDSIVAQLLGVPLYGRWVYDHGFGRVGPQFIQRAIAAVGNYGEIYARTIGDAIPRACSLNALAIDSSVDCPSGQGGLMYALPYR